MAWPGPGRNRTVALTLLWKGKVQMVLQVAVRGPTQGWCGRGGVAVFPAWPHGGGAEEDSAGFSAIKEAWGPKMTTGHHEGTKCIGVTPLNALLSPWPLNQHSQALAAKQVAFPLSSLKASGEMQE